MFAVKKREKRIDILLPSSFAEDTPNPREWTMRVGILGRALAAARIETLILYHEDPENPRKKNAEKIRLVMNYLNAAPYLRRKLYPLTKTLRYVGILPPLNIPTHPEKKTIEEEHYREGLVISSNKETRIDAGLGKPVTTKKKIPAGARVIVKVEPGEKPRLKVISKKKAKVYSGFKTTIVGESISEITSAYDYRIATSRLGEDVRKKLNHLERELGKAKRICVAFGSAKNGLHQIVSRQGDKIEEVFDTVLNFYPDQGVRTIRTEEAVYYVLGILNLITA